MNRNYVTREKIMKIQLFLSSSLLILNCLVYSAEEKKQPAKGAVWQQAHIRIREPHIQPKQYLSILEKLPQTALDTITENLTYEQLTHFAEGSLTLRENLEPAFRKKLIDYWKQPLEFIGMRPEDPYNRQILLDRPPSDTYQSIVFSPNGKFLATGSTGSGFLLWELKSPAPVHAEFLLWQEELQIPTVIPMNWVLGKKAIILRELKTPIISMKSLINVVTFSPGGTILAGTYNLRQHNPNFNEILFWEMLTGRLIKRLDASTEMIYSVAFSPDGQLLASETSLGEYSKIRIWHQTRTVRKELNTSASNSLIVFSPDGTMFAALSVFLPFRSWDLKGHKITELDHPTYVKSIAFSPDGTLLATGSRDSTIRLWQVKADAEVKIAADRVSHASIKELQGHNGPVDSLAFSPHGTLLASASKGNVYNEGDKTIRLWDVTTSKQMRRFDGTGPLAFSPDGQLLATCGMNGYMGLWQAYQPVPSAPK